MPLFYKGNTIFLDNVNTMCYNGISGGGVDLKTFIVRLAPRLIRLWVNQAIRDLQENNLELSFDNIINTIELKRDLAQTDRNDIETYYYENVYDLGGKQ